MALIKCKECGKAFSEYAECCPECGCPVVAKESNDKVNFPQKTEQSVCEVSEQSQQPTEQTSNKNRAVFIILSIALLCAIGIGAYFILGGKGNTNTDDTSDSLAVNETSSNQSSEQSSQYIYSGLSFRTFTEREYDEYNKVEYQARLELTGMGENLKDRGFELIDSKTEFRPDYTGEDFYEVTVETYAKNVNGNITKVILEEEYTEIQFPNVDDVEEFKKTIRACNLKETEDGYYMPSVKDMRTNGFDFSQCKIISEKDYYDLVRNGCKPEKNASVVCVCGTL